MFGLVLVLACGSFLGARLFVFARTGAGELVCKAGESGLEVAGGVSDGGGKSAGGVEGRDEVACGPSVGVDLPGDDVYEGSEVAFVQARTAPNEVGDDLVCLP